MAKAEAMTNINNAPAATGFFKAIGQSAPGGSSVNRTMAKNANTFYEKGGEAVEAVATAADSLAAWAWNALTFLTKNWKVVIVAAVAAIVLFKKI